MNNVGRGIPNSNLPFRDRIDAAMCDVVPGANGTEQNAKHGNPKKNVENPVIVDINSAGSSSNNSDLLGIKKKQQPDRTYDGGTSPRPQGRGLGTIHEMLTVRKSEQVHQEQQRTTPETNNWLPPTAYPQASHLQGQGQPSPSFFSPTTRKYICAAIGVAGGSAVGVGAYIGYSIAHKKLVADGLLGSNSPPWMAPPF
ncbi:MAG: hypothetical protein H7327_06825 [Herminiimonas sp.]|nr:hypothetical protein [Herminiimonas sp.]